MKREQKKRIKYYLNVPIICPFCEDEHTDIEAFGGIQADSTIAWGEVKCNRCERVWRDEYVLTAISWREGNIRIYSDENFNIKT